MRRALKICMLTAFIIAFVLVLDVWVRAASSPLSTKFYIQLTGFQFTLQASNSKLVAIWMEGTKSTDGRFRAPPGTFWSTKYTSTLSFAGFAYKAAPSGGQWAKHGILTVPFWLLTALPVIAIGALWLTSKTRMRLRRINRGCCQHCGYDLRGSGDSTTCPECGDVIGLRARRVMAMVRTSGNDG